MADEHARSGLFGIVLAVLRQIAVVVVGAFAGGALNMGILRLGAVLLPPPAGVDINDVNSINANIDKYSALDLMVPFAAHALGTLLGAFVAALLAATPRMRLRAAIVVGCLNLAGGAMAVHMIPNAPLWFDVLDLGVAYIPMALLGWRLAARR